VKLTPRFLAITVGTVIAVGAMFGVSACSHQSNSPGLVAEQATSNQDITTYEQAQPAPHFGYSEIRQAAIKVEASQALGEQTTSFFFNSNVRDPLFTCSSVGDPIPFSTEITNPQQPANYYNKGSGNNDTVVVGNIDPNGIYAPAASAGTNVMCVNGSGQQYLVYWEGDVLTVNGAARWDSASGQIVVIGQPVMPTCKLEKVGGKNETVCTK
jgi:hypothetical protein